MTDQKLGIRLSRLTIKNYKKLDSLEIDFPRPVMEGDADILLFGSKNGGGKTSVLECCSLLILAGVIGDKINRIFRESDSLIDVADLLVKAGESQAIISGIFEMGSESCGVELKIASGAIIESQTDGNKAIFEIFKKGFRGSEPETLVNSILSFSGEPLIMPPLLHFNSYRKIQESKPELGMMADDYSKQRDLRIRSRLGMRFSSNPISSFKLEILNSLMVKADLFEGFDQKDEAKSALHQLNSLIQRYGGGQVEHLRALPDNKVDIRVKPSSGGESFSFDGLSSGQKEIIATLFLIWKNTQQQPCIVLIDEPELHLNAEWHGDFVRQLYKLAPHNQYILATHSETMFSSVDESCRAVLVPNNSNGEVL
jgi:hypothetical protein